MTVTVPVTVNLKNGLAAVSPRDVKMIDNSTIYRLLIQCGMPSTKVDDALIRFVRAVEGGAKKECAAREWLNYFPSNRDLGDIQKEGKHYLCEGSNGNFYTTKNVDEKNWLCVIRFAEINL